MARIRSIKPEFWSSEQVMECSPNARLLFIGIWNFCDDAGRHPAAPKQIKALVYPSDPFTVEDIQGMLDELSRVSLIEFYTIDGKRFLRVTGWQHQKIDKPQKPRFPGPGADHSTNDPGTFPVGKEHREDGIGEDQELASASSSARARPLTRDWQPSEACSDRKRAEGWTTDALRQQAPKFARHSIAKNVKFAGHEAADAAFESWCDRAVEFGEYTLRKPGGGTGTEPAEFVEIRVGDPEWHAWLASFADTGRRASVAAMHEAESLGKPFPVPTRWPPGDPHAQAAA